MSGDAIHADIAAVIEREPGGCVIQLMERCDPEDDPHGDGARLVREITADEAMLP